MAARLTDHLVESPDGTRIACGRLGDGPPLVLVHGTTGDRGSFRLLAPLLADEFALFIVDRRGRGGSSGDAADYAIEREFEDIAAVVDSIGAPVALFGHSYGADIAIGAAPLCRSVGRLVLYEPAAGVADVPEEPLARAEELIAAGDRERALTTILAEVVGLDAGEIEALRTSPTWDARRAAVHTVPREMRAERAYRPEPAAFKSIDSPVTLLLGTESPRWARAGADAGVALFPHGRIVELEGVGHGGNLSHPAVLAAAIRAALTATA